MIFLPKVEDDSGIKSLLPFTRILMSCLGVCISKQEKFQYVRKKWIVKFLFPLFFYSTVQDKGRKKKHIWRGLILKRVHYYWPYLPSSNWSPYLPLLNSHMKVVNYVCDREKCTVSQSGDIIISWTSKLLHFQSFDEVFTSLC